MPFVKLDCGMLNSSLWPDHDARTVFITALLMAVPREFRDPVPQIEVDSLENTGFVAPLGWYGLVEAAGCGIILRSGIDSERGKDALVRLGSPDIDSRSQKCEGRRLIRIDGGYLVINYFEYRNRDYTAAERQRRYREKKRNTVTEVTSRVTLRDVTQAEAYKGDTKRAGKHLTRPDGSPTRIGTKFALLASDTARLNQLPHST